LFALDVQSLRLSGNPEQFGEGNEIISEDVNVLANMVDDISMMEGVRENEDEDEEMETDSSSNIPGASSFKDKVMGVLQQGEFLEKRASKLTQTDFLYLLSLFNKAGIHFS
jgi:18S rRNA (adenine1779-N6/adenine1780-N6)-dimethyltransferase